MPSLVLGPVLRHVGPHHATVWVEVDARCEVSVLGARQKTFEVSGHHYALVQVLGLPAGAALEYDVRLNGERVWPAGPDPEKDASPGVSDSGRPSSHAFTVLSQPSQIHTLDPGRPRRIAFGSCRVPTQHTAEGRKKYGTDALEAYAVRIADHRGEGRPDLMLMLGDQVYADETTELTQRRIATRRDLGRPPHGQVADFEEYTWLYLESWSDPGIRRLMSTLPTAMIFDDHDVHDDWNTSRAWRTDMQRTSWWAERIVGGLISYWVYQHIGNLSPDDLAADEIYQQVLDLAETGQDAEPMLREFAVRADAEADGGKGYRWSFWRDLGRTRLVVIDSRCGRMLDAGNRSMLSEAEFAWVRERVEGDYDHLLIGTSLPWLTAPAIHRAEAWSEHWAEGTGRRAVIGEKLRQAGDLEHWPAFRDSFDRLAQMIADVAAGHCGPRAPATISVLSGDVHHSYFCEADVTPLMRDVPREVSKVYQLTCSPVHNTIPGPMRLAFSVSWTRPMTWAARLLFGRARTVPETLVKWWTIGGPVFGNAVSTLFLEDRAARVVLESTRTASAGNDWAMKTEIARDLS